MRNRYPLLASLGLALLVGGPGAARAEQSAPPVCPLVAKVPLTQQLRQIYLDLLNRPPTVDEYKAAVAKGSVSAEDVRALMKTEDFYTRMRGFHRALLKSNVSASVYNDSDTKLSQTGNANDPLANRDDPSTGLRGKRSESCNGYLLQDTEANCMAAPDEDPQFQLGARKCFDEMGIPLPLSADYNTDNYRCDQLDVTDTSITSCDAAITKGAVPEDERFFCDMRRVGAVLHPFRCYPRPDNPSTALLTEKVLDGNGHAIAYKVPAGTPPGVFTQLDRCTLTLRLASNVKGNYTVQPGCILREGYVKRPPPYWDTTGRTEVTVCAIEAQDRTVNPWTQQTCESTRFKGDRSCGCGDKARRCEPAANTVQTARINAINMEPELIADSVLRRDEPYYNILTTRRSFVNGPLAALYNQQQGVGVFNTTAPARPGVLPELAYTADPNAWVEYTRDENHAGVLTTPAFLFRFPTHRAQVSEFYEAFVCKAFAPPSNAIAPAPDDACNRENNLAKRCGCTYCHAILEPTGAHWGRYAERSAQFLDPAFFPRFDPKCRDCALAGDTNCGGNCGNYVMQAYDGDGASSLGMLKTYLYRSTSEEENIAGGPRLLVERMLQTGDMERCTVKRVWKDLLGRPMSSQEEQLYLPKLYQGFNADHQLKGLMEAVVTTDAYWRRD